MNMLKTNRRPSTGAELVNILLGIALALSPFILGFTRPAAKWNNIAVGLAIVVVTLLGWADEALAPLVVLLGAWLFWSPFFLGFSTAAFLATNVAMAFAVIAAGASGDGLRLPEAGKQS